MTIQPSSSDKLSAVRPPATASPAQGPQVGAVPPPHFRGKSAKPEDKSAHVHGKAAHVHGKAAPRYEVDHFRYGEVCDTLVRGSSEVFAPLVSLMGHSTGSGAAAYLFTSIRPAAGRKTMLISTARLLNSAGRRVLMIDAAFAQPRLAHRLRLLPQAGWDQTLLHGGKPLDAAVEALEDRLALLPLRQAVEIAYPARHAAAVQRSITALRGCYDLLLIDGGLLDQAMLSALPCQALSGAVLVTDPSVTPEIGVTAAAQVLTSAGVSTWHHVENFQV